RKLFAIVDAPWHGEPPAPLARVPSGWYREPARHLWPGTLQHLWHWEPLGTSGTGNQFESDADIYLHPASRVWPLRNDPLRGVAVRATPFFDWEDVSEG